MPKHRLLAAALFALASASTLPAQTTLFFNPGENNGTEYDTMGNSLTLNIVSGSANQNGTVYGTGNVIKNGAGTIVLSPNTTYTGSTAIEAGTLVLNGTTTSSAFGIASGATLELNVGTGVLRDHTASTTFSGAGTLAKTGAGTVKWGSPAATFALASGALIDVRAGSLTGGSNANEVWTNNLSDLNVASGATFAGVEANVRVDALTGSGTIASGLNGAGYTAFTFGVDGGSGTFSGVLADTDTGGGHIGNFVKAGAGTQILTGVNTYTGTTTISGGTLQIGDGGTTGSLASASIINNANLAFNRADASAYSGVISGTGSLTQSGTGTLTLSDNNTYGGGTTISGGVLVISSDTSLGTAPGSATAGHLTLNGGTIATPAYSGFELSPNRGVSLGSNGGTFATAVESYINYQGIISGPGSLTKTGDGTLTLYGTNSYEGGTSVSGGRLNALFGGSLGSGDISITSGTLSGIFLLNLNVSTVVTGPNSHLTTSSPSAFMAWGYGVNETGSLTVTEGGKVASASTTTFGADSGSVGTGTLSGSGSSLVSTGQLYLGTDGTGTLTLADGATVRAPRLNIGVNPGSHGTLNLNSGGTFQTGGTNGILSGSGTANLNFNGGTLQVITTSLTTGSAITLGSGTTSIVDSNGFDALLAGTLSGSGSLTKSGTGTLTLSGANTYSGATTVSNGTLSIAADSALGAAPGSATPGHLTLDGGTLATTASFALAANRGLALGSSGGTINTADATTLSYDGIIAGDGAFTKAGVGTLTLTGSNTYSGGTTISAGTLSGNTTSLQGDITNHAALLFDQASAGTYADSISGTGSLTKTGAGTLALSGANTYSGTTTISAGTVLFSAPASLYNGVTADWSKVSVANDAHLAVGVTSAGFGTADISALLNNVTFASGTGALELVLPDNHILAQNLNLDLSGTSTPQSALTLSGATPLKLNGHTLTLGVTGEQTLTVDRQLTGGSDDAGNGSGGPGGTLSIIQGSVTFTQAVDISGGLGSVFSGDGGTLSVTQGSASFAETVNLSGGAGFNSPSYLFDGGAGGNGGTISITQGSVTLGQTVTISGGAGGNAPSSDFLVGGHGGGGGSFAVSGGIVNFGTGASLYLEGGNGGNADVGGSSGAGGSLTVSGGALAFSAESTVSLASGIAGSGPKRNGSTGALGTLTLSGGSLSLPTAGWLENTSTFNGNFTFTGGTLKASDAGETLALDGTSKLGQALANASVTAGRTLDVAGNLSLSGALAGTGALTKASTGTLSLTGDNTAFTGTTTVSAGTLVFANTSAFATGTLDATSAAKLTVADGATARFALSDTGTTYFSGTDLTTLQANASLAAGSTLALDTAAASGAVTTTYTGAQNLAKVGTGTLILSGTNSGTGSITVSGGSLQIGDGFSSTSLAASGIASDSTVSFNLGSSLTFGGSYSGTGGLTKSGFGTLTLSAANTFGGDTLLSSGELAITHSQALQNSTVSVNGGMLTLSGVTNATFGGLAGSGSFNLPSATLTVGGNGQDTSFTGNLYNSGTLTKVANGTLTFGGTLQDYNTTVNIYGGRVLLTNGTGLQNSTVFISGDNYLDLGTLASATLGALSGSGDLSLSTTDTEPLAIALTVGGNGASTSYFGDLSGAGSLTKTGFGTLTLSGTNTHTGTTTVSGGTLALSGSNVLGASTLVLNGGDATTSGSTTVGGLAGNGMLTLSGGSTFTFGGNHADTSFSGTVFNPSTLVKTSDGNFTLSGSFSNASNSSLRIDSGTVTLNSDSVLADTQLNLNGGSLAFGNLTSASIAGLAGSGDILLAQAASPTTGLALTVGSISSSSSSTYSGVLSGPGSLTKQGMGTLTLSGANTFTGTTTVSAGGLTLASGSALAGDVTVSSMGTLTLQDDDALASSTLTLNSGAMISFGSLGNVSLGALAGSANLTLPGSPNDEFSVGANDASTTYSGQLSGNATLVKAGSGNFTFSGSFLSNPANLRIDAGKVTVGNSTSLDKANVHLNGGTLSFGTQTSVDLYGLQGSGDLVLQNDSADAVALTLVSTYGDTTYSGSLSGTGSLTKSGNNTVTLAGASTHTGGTTLGQGTLALDSADTLAGSLHVTGGTLRIADANALRTADLAIDSGSLAFDTITTAHIGSLAGFGGFALQNESGDALALTTGSTHADTQIDGTLSGSGSLIKTGTGKLTLNGGNTYQGSTTINGGTLEISSSSALGATPASFDASHLTLDGGTLANTGSASLSANHGVLLGASGGTFATADDLNIAGVISGPGSLAKSGSGTLTLSGTNTYTGGTTVSAGTLLGNASSLQGNINNNAAVTFDQASSSTYAGVLSGSGSLTKIGAGTLTLSGANTYTGATTLDAGSLIVDGSLATSAVTVNSGATLSGSGTVGALALTSGAILSPGNSPGTLTTGSEIWAGGASYLWEINDAASPATGAGTRYDLLSISGTLTINATTSDKFTLSLVSLLANNSAGDVINFNSAANSAYTIASASGGIIGFDANAFTINASGFSNALNGGTWSLALANSDRDLQLNFTAASAIPEPSTYAAIFGALVLGCVVLRKRKTNP